MGVFNHINGLLGRPVIFAQPEHNDKFYPDDAIVFRSYVPDNIKIKEGRIALVIYVDDVVVATLYENDEKEVRLDNDVSYIDGDTSELDKLLLMHTIHALISIHSTHSIRVDRVIVVNKDIGKMA